ncbi:MAG: hypothetical protein JO121_22360 [Deltaproteobacteria bacterium]|nr:hypothetical protein [Deltaproteobacteria bacterium]
MRDKDNATSSRLTTYTRKDHGAVPQVAGVARIFIEPIRDLAQLSSLYGRDLLGFTWKCSV